MADPVVVGYEGQKFIIDTNTRALGLYRPNYAGAGSFWSARETGGDGDAAYVVPASKKFCLLQHNWTCIGAEGQIFIYDHDTADSSGGTQVWQGSGVLDLQCSTPYYREFAAGQYINMKSDATNLNWTLFGVETDA
jgi:hypothetical protein|tara:strand:+ start:550 stop:957 length:408 start_codon:yes stop_codon:yes gene_type:complete